MTESFSEKIEYGQIIRVDSPKTYSSDLVDIEFSKSSANRTVRIRAKTNIDATSIRNAIVEKITEYKRKVEVENAMRARYRVGNFNEISPYYFEKVIQELFTNMGYSVRRIGGTSDGGIDLRCSNSSTNEKAIVQCKRYSGNVGIGVIRDFYGTLIHSEVDKGFVVTTSDFTKEAKAWSKGKPIVLIDGKKLSQLMMTYYK